MALGVGLGTDSGAGTERWAETEAAGRGQNGTGNVADQGWGWAGVGQELSGKWGLYLD